MTALIAAFADNRVMGKNGRLPWHIPEDLKRFRSLTEGHTVIMGRRSFEEIGRALANRQTIVLSRNPAFTAEGCTVARSLTEAISRADRTEIFIAGGASVYAEALPLCDRLYITRIDARFDGDTFFPDFDETAFSLTEETAVSGEIPCRFLTYDRIRHKTSAENL